MSIAEALGFTRSAAPLKPASTSQTMTQATGDGKASDALKLDREPKRERFIPVTRFAIRDRLTQPGTWPRRELKDAQRFFRYLDYWRHQQHNANLLELEQTYEPFSPDSDLLMTRAFTPEERGAMQRRLISGMAELLERANYERIDPTDIETILTRDSTYGLDLNVDMEAFDEVLIFYRGATTRRETRRVPQKFFLKEEFDVPIFQRLCIVFKLKPRDAQVRDVMATRKLSRREAEKIVKRSRASLPPQIKDENVYMKLFKNIPRNDIEMIFPNTEVRFRFWDKLRLGGSAGVGVGAGVYGAATKFALLVTNPITAVPAVAGVGGILFRQGMNIVNQKQRYMEVLARSLYFHSMADNRGVMIKLADRAAEEDVKEEMLLYAVLAKETCTRADLPEIDRAIERYLAASFGVNVNFDLDDALDRLVKDKLVGEAADGTLTTLPPKAAALHIDKMWDVFLDDLPAFSEADEGVEVESSPAPEPEGTA